MKKVLPLLISIIALVFNILSVEASENTLSGVDIKSGANSYTIELTTNEPAKMTKTIISSNRVLVTLNNVKASNNISTKYGKNAVIDNVIVEPQGNNVSIMLQGDNIAYSDVSFKAPTSMKQIQDNVVDSVSALTTLGNTAGQNKTIPCIFLVILAGVLVYEIKFIKSKYSELNVEKSLLEKDMERTAEFKDFMQGYGNQGITKPNTTPIYTNPTNPTLVRANYLQRLKTLKTPETVTLNSLLSNNNQETNIINQVVKHNKPVFGSLSNLTIETKELQEMVEKMQTRETLETLETETREVTPSAQPVSNPVSPAKMKSQLAQLEELSKLYRQTSNTPETLERRLNNLY